MKKQLLLLTLLLSTAINSFADEVKIGRLWYEVITKAKEAKVIQYKNYNYYSGNIAIPETVEYYGVTCSVTSIGYEAFLDCSGLTSVTIPNSVTYIGNYAFSRCSGLTSVTIPNSVTIIGNQPFNGCSGLTSISVDAGNTAYDSRDNCNAIIETAYNVLLTGCKSTIIPNSVTYIGSNAFQGCSGLTSVTIPNSVTGIEDYAFDKCSGLTSVTIPNSVTIIGWYAFRSCSALTSVIIGSGIKNIGTSAFAYCTELTDVYCYAESVPSTESDAFTNSAIKYATLHVPTASIDAYKAAAPWSGFKTFMGLDGTLPDNPTEETKKCATPTISLVDGELQFSCETEGVEYVSEVSFVDGKQYFGSKVSLTGVYKVSVYATKSGYENSDVATAEFTMSSGSGIKGDVNGDGKVDVSDVVGTANIILQKQ